jgi:hypothetical protein
MNDAIKVPNVGGVFDSVDRRKKRMRPQLIVKQDPVEDAGARGG